MNIFEAITLDDDELFEDCITYSGLLGSRNDRKETPLIFALKIGSFLKAIRLINERLFIDEYDLNGDTALHMVTLDNNQYMVQLLLSAGANLNIRNIRGDTPIHIVAKNGNLVIAKLLVEHGADITLENDVGNTPLRIASQFKHVEVAKLLIRELKSLMRE